MIRMSSAMCKSYLLGVEAVLHCPHTTPQDESLLNPPDATHRLHYQCHQTDILSLIPEYQPLLLHTWCPLFWDQQPQVSYFFESHCKGVLLTAKIKKRKILSVICLCLFLLFKILRNKLITLGNTLNPNVCHLWSQA